MTTNENKLAQALRELLEYSMVPLTDVSLSTPESAAAWDRASKVLAYHDALAAQAEQQAGPVATVTRFHDLGGEIDWTGRVICPVGTKLYTHPVEAELVPQLREEIAMLKLAEEGAAEAFGVVVQDKRDLEAEVRRLQTLLEGAHALIRKLAKGAQA